MRHVDLHLPDTSLTVGTVGVVGLQGAPLEAVAALAREGTQVL